MDAAFQMSPDVTSATDLVIAASIHQVLLTFGQQRVVLSQDDKGELKATQAIHWFTTLAVSPSTAKMMVQTLSQAIEGFEKDNYKLPDFVEVTTLKK